MAERSTAKVLQGEMSCVSPAEDGARRRTDEQEFGLAQLPPSPPTTVAVIESIATGAPSRVVDQSEARRPGRRVVRAIRSSGSGFRGCIRRRRIATRRMAVDPLDAEFDALRREPGTIRDRMNLFYQHAVPLAVEVAGRALAAPSETVTEIGLLVFVTSTGFIAPGVDVAIVKQLGLSPSVSRVVVNFMGCAAAMNAIRTATDYVRANPDMKAMVVCIELCSVNAVFADDINDVIISQPVRRRVRGGGHRRQPGPTAAGAGQGGDPQ